MYIIYYVYDRYFGPLVMHGYKAANLKKGMPSLYEPCVHDVIVDSYVTLITTGVGGNMGFYSQRKTRQSLHQLVDSGWLSEDSGQRRTSKCWKGVSQ